MAATLKGWLPWDCLIPSGKKKEIKIVSLGSAVNGVAAVMLGLVVWSGLYSPTTYGALWWFVRFQVMLVRGERALACSGVPCQ